jgi:hypothetical protein
MSAEDATWRLDLTEPRSVRSIITTALALYRRYPLLFLILAAGVVVPYELIVLAVTGYGPLRQWHVPGVAGAVILPVLELGFVSAFVSALHIHAVALAGRGERPTLGDVARRSAPVLPVVTATSVMYGLGTTLGSLALFIPGLILSLMWAVAPQAAAIENNSWFEALRRSRQLARERWLHIFGLTFAGGLILAAIVVPASQIAAGHASSLGLVSLGIAVTTIRQSFVALTYGLLYFDLIARPPIRRAERTYQRPHDLDP